MPDTSFSIERYQKLVVEDQTHILILDDSKQSAVRIICTERKATWPIVALINKGPVENESETVEYYTVNQATAVLQIVPKPPKSLGWINIYKADFLHDSKGAAEQYAKVNTLNNRLACVEIFEGQGL